MGYYAGSYFSKTKTFKQFFSSSNKLLFLKKIIDTMVITFSHAITNKKYIKLIIILILIYFSEIIAMFFCLKFLGFNISFNLFLIFFITINLSSLIGIFPKNIAIAELVVGSVFKKYSLNFSDGVFVNLINRFFYLFIYLIFAFLLFIITQKRLKIFKQ